MPPKLINFHIVFIYIASTGTTGFTGFGSTGSAFGTNSAFRPPASNFGTTNTSTFGANPGTSTGLFGATTQASSGGLFGATQVCHQNTDFIKWNIFYLSLVVKP